MKYFLKFCSIKFDVGKKQKGAQESSESMLQCKNSILEEDSLRVGYKR